MFKKKTLWPVLVFVICLALVWPGGVSVKAAPSNDEFDFATEITGLPFYNLVDISDATVSMNEPVLCNTSEKTVWYKFTATEDVKLKVDLSSSSFYNTNLEVYQAGGPSIPDLSYVGCALYGGSVTFTAWAGNTYYFQAGKYAYDPYPAPGEEYLQVNVEIVLPDPPPLNDDFSDAEGVLSLPFNGWAQIESATLEDGEPIPSCVDDYYYPRKTVWYAYTPTENENLVASLDWSWSGSHFLGVYTGSEPADLAEIGCRSYWENLPFQAQAGTTYYFQVGGIFDWSGNLSFWLSVLPPLSADFSYYPMQPSQYDTIQFYDMSYDPNWMGFQSYAWDFGDGTTGSGSSPTHKYGVDGEFTVSLTVTTNDGRCASISKVITLSTHDVAIVRMNAPKSASSGQTRQITVEVRNYITPENVRVNLYKSVPGGFEMIGYSDQTVPVRSGNRTTTFSFNYTFTSGDAQMGKVTFKAVAELLEARDAFPADNEAISPPTKVTK
jgi:hypothetical protein